MDIKILVEIMLAGGAVLAGFFGLIRYMINSNTKREKFILEHNENQQTKMLEFYESKNGHLERITERFSESNDKMTDAVGKLTTEIKVLAERHNNHN